MECKKCKQLIRGETGIHCEGICKNVFHTKTKCSGLEDYALNALNQYSMLRFMCENCVTYIHNMDHVMKNLQCEINRNNILINEYKGEFESTLKHNENEIKQLLEAIENKYSERIRAMQKVQGKCDLNIREVKKN